MTNRSLALPLLVSVLGLVGCGRHLEFQDNFSGLFEESIQRPYALGTEVSLDVHWSSYDRVSSWEAVSDDPAVVQVVSQSVDSFDHNSLKVQLKAAGEGQTHVVIKDGSRRVGAVSVRVVRPVAVTLLDHALQRTKDVEEEVGDEIRVVAGQPTAMEIRYLGANQERAWGKDLVTWPELTGLSVWTDAETLGRDAEYLLVQPDSTGTFDLPVRVNGEDVRTLRVIGVPESDIASIQLLPPPEDHAKTGDRLCAGISAFDASGRRIYGPPAEWTLAGEAIGEGDLLCYDYAPSEQAQAVTVAVGGTGAQVAIRGENFHPASTATIGCSAAGSGGGLAGGVAGVLLLFGCALLLRRILCPGDPRRAPAAPAGRPRRADPLGALRD
jgi:hypothetical protein